MGFKIIQTERDYYEHEKKVEELFNRIGHRKIISMQSGQYDTRMVSKNNVPYMGTFYFTHVAWVD
jgi:hypothetical protein